MTSVVMFPNKDDVRRMSEMMRLGVPTIAAGGVDFFCQVAAGIGAPDARMGQFSAHMRWAAWWRHLHLATWRPGSRRRGFDPGRHIWVEAVRLSRATFH